MLLQHSLYGLALCPSLAVIHIHLLGLLSSFHPLFQQELVCAHTRKHKIVLTQNTKKDTLTQLNTC